MAQGRFLHKRISVNRDLPKLMAELDARYGFGHGAYCSVLFTMMLPWIDVEGRLHGDPCIVKGRCVPRVAELTLERVELFLGALDAAGLVVWYEANGDRWLWFPGFEKSQPGLRKDREESSQCPPPPASRRSDSGAPPAAPCPPPEPSRPPSGAPPIPPGQGEVEAEVQDQGEGEARAERAPGFAHLGDTFGEALARLYQELWIERYRPADGIPPATGKPQCMMLQALAQKHEPGNVAQWLRAYLRDDKAFLVERRHSLRWFPEELDRYRTAAPTKGPAQPRAAVAVGGEVAL
jgi:hypothetical protein